MKRFGFYLLLIGTFIASFVATVSAQDVPTPTPDPLGIPTTPPLTVSGAPFCEVGNGVFLDSCEIDEKKNKVIVRFYGYRIDEKELPEIFGKYFCYKSDQSKCEEDDFKEIKNVTGGIIEEEVCGDGENALMGKLRKRKNGCEDKDYFFQGKIYKLGLYAKKNKNTKIAEAAFYIKHFYPDVTVESTPTPPSSARVVFAKITATIRGIRESKNQSGEKQNNYKLLLQPRDNNSDPQEKCVVVDQKTQSVSHSFERIRVGKYQLKVQEEVKDGGENGNCDGGFTYWIIPITVNADGTVKVGKLIKDPNNVESRQQSQNSGPLPPPCVEADRTPDGRCLAIQTAIGKISVQPDTFVSGIYSWFLSLASVAGLILLLRAGYKLITSGGNKEKVGEAREEIKSVIFGILFLVVALVMLEAIGTDILKIPGFK